MDLSSLVLVRFYGIPVLPFFIFFARILDVSSGTLRIIFVARGYRALAPVFGFFEVTIWLIAASQVITNVTSPILIIAYGAGYATGNYIGMWIENRLKLGLVMLRIITRKDATSIVNYLRLDHHPVVKLEAEGSHGPVNVIFMVLKRKALSSIINTLKHSHPHAYFSIEDVREVHEGVYPEDRAMKLIGAVQEK